MTSANWCFWADASATGVRLQDLDAPAGSGSEPTWRCWEDVAVDGSGDLAWWVAVVAVVALRLLRGLDTNKSKIGRWLREAWSGES